MKPSRARQPKDDINKSIVHLSSQVHQNRGTLEVLVRRIVGSLCLLWPVGPLPQASVGFQGSSHRLIAPGLLKRSERAETGAGGVKRPWELDLPTPKESPYHLGAPFRHLVLQLFWEYGAIM